MLLKSILSPSISFLNILVLLLKFMSYFSSECVSTYSNVIIFIKLKFFIFNQICSFIKCCHAYLFLQVFDPFLVRIRCDKPDYNNNSSSHSVSRAIKTEEERLRVMQHMRDRETCFWLCKKRQKKSEAYNLTRSHPCKRIIILKSLKFMVPVWYVFSIRSKLKQYRSLRLSFFL